MRVPGDLLLRYRQLERTHRQKLPRTSFIQFLCVGRLANALARRFAAADTVWCKRQWRRAGSSCDRVWWCLP